MHYASFSNLVLLWGGGWGEEWRENGRGLEVFKVLSQFKPFCDSIILCCC